MRKPHALFALAAVLVVTSTAGCAPPQAAAEPPALADSLDQVVRDWQQRAWIPGVAVSVRRGSEPVWSGAAGLADRESQTAMDPSMPSFIASVTKPLVAVTVLRLVDLGELGLDDPLARYVPDFPRAGEVTIRHLLGMRSGIPDYTRAWGFMDELEEDLRENRERKWAEKELLAITADAPFEFSPGERYAYSNTNYILLGEVIEAVTGGPWWQALNELVATPLGLSATMFPVEGTPARLVTGYADIDRDAFVDSLAGRPFGSVITSAGAAGGLVSTPDDLTLFARSVFAGDFLSAGSKAAMIAVGQAGYEREYGLGMAVHLPDLRTRVAGHTGTMIGYSSLVWYAPDHDLAISVLVNDGMAAPEDLAELLLREVIRHPPG